MTGSTPNHDMKMKVRYQKNMCFQRRVVVGRPFLLNRCPQKKITKIVAKNMSLQWRMPSEHLVSASVGGMAAAAQGLVDSRDNWRTPTSVPMVLCSLGITGKRSLSTAVNYASQRKKVSQRVEQNYRGIELVTTDLLLGLVFPSIWRLLSQY